MASSIREQIVAALIAALNGSSGISGLSIHRERTRPIETDSLPAIMVYFEDDAPKPFDRQKFRSPLVERDLAVALECRAQGSQSVSPDAALDPVLVWAVKGGFADETLGGLALGAEEGRTAWRSREGDVPVAAATLHFTIHYRTSRLDPTANPTNT
ncbi:MAG: hypothetical protein ABSE45_15020 [Candidatus Acidiferrales bacterium]|jgi:hypothetical protein